MCSTSSSPLGLSALIMDTLVSSSSNSTSKNANNSLAAQYTSSLQDLEHSQAAARLASQSSIASGVALRKKQQHQAAQEAGQARAGFAASGLAMDGGSILNLMTDTATQVQAESADITRQISETAESQRLSDSHYDQKKAFLHQDYQRKRSDLNSNTLLGSYNQLYSGLASLLR